MNLLRKKLLRTFTIADRKNPTNINLEYGEKACRPLHIRISGIS